jgi:hypothetical protein
MNIFLNQRFKYKEVSVVQYLNFPRIVHLPKKLHKKDLKIISFDKTKIVVGGKIATNGSQVYLVRT